MTHRIVPTKRAARTFLMMLGVPSLFAAAGRVSADTVTFTVTGQIVSGTCELSAGDQNRTVTLAPIGTSDMPASGKAAKGAASFTLTVENCAAGLSTATFTFAGTPDPNDNMRYQNTGNATGVAVELESTSDGQTIGANGTNSSRTAPISGSQASLDLTAYYWRIPSVALAAGAVRSIATVTASYN